MYADSSAVALYRSEKTNFQEGDTDQKQRSVKKKKTPKDAEIFAEKNEKKRKQKVIECLSRFLSVFLAFTDTHTHKHTCDCTSTRPSRRECSNVEIGLYGVPSTSTFQKKHP